MKTRTEFLAGYARWKAGATPHTPEGQFEHFRRPRLTIGF
jgi:hypothetical protein